MSASPANAAAAGRRLRNQSITGVGRRKPADVVASSGAVQAQEYEPAKWGLGLRMQDGATDAQIERAFERGEILRTHVMRPTWHFVTPDDIRWLLELTAPRVHQRMAPYDRQLELDTKTMVRGTAVIERALRDKQHLTRSELADRLRDSKLAITGMRLAHLALYAELEAVICSGPRRGKQFTYALLAERAPGARRLQRDEALFELSRRYFGSHGPATIRDFVWWSGLTTGDAKRGLEMARARREDVGGRTYWSIDLPRRGRRRDSLAHLLPIYDEVPDCLPGSRGRAARAWHRELRFERAGDVSTCRRDRRAGGGNVANRQGREGSIDCCDTPATVDGTRAAGNRERGSQIRTLSRSSRGPVDRLVDWTTGRSRGSARARQPSRQAAINRCGARGSAKWTPRAWQG